MRNEIGRRLSPLAMVAALLSGCGGGGDAMEPDILQAGAPENHGLNPGDRITVEAGGVEDRGNVTIDCPADALECAVVVADDGTVGYDSSGGLPDIQPRVVPAEAPEDHGLSPGDRIEVEAGDVEDHGNVTIDCSADASTCAVVVAADGTVGYESTGGLPDIRHQESDEIEDILSRLQSPGSVFGFGGAVATCEALGCRVIDAIHVVQTSDGDARRDLSGFEPLDPRGGVEFALKEEIVEEEDGHSSIHRTLGGWMDNGFFLIETFTRNQDDSFVYETVWLGDVTLSNPVAVSGGAATWSGIMSGVETRAYGNSGAFYHGDAAVTARGLGTEAGASVDIVFSNIVSDAGGGVPDMRWDGLPLRDGQFGTDDVLFWRDGDGEYGYFPSDSFGAAAQGSIFGQTYGTEHDEVGGLFHRDGIAGAFAARREP